MITAVEQEPCGSAQEFEARCRAYYLAQDRGVYYTGIALLSMPILLFSYSDFLLFGTGPVFRVLAGLRLAFLAVTVCTFLALPRIPGGCAADGIITVWCLLLCAVVIFINSSRPPDYVQHSMLDILILMTLYFLFPLPAPLHALAPIVFSAGNLLLIFTIKSPVSPLAYNVFIITYVLGNALGLYTARRMLLYRRSHFLALEQERDLRAELEEALINLKVLQGMLPICAHCKKVRDDQAIGRRSSSISAPTPKRSLPMGYAPTASKSTTATWRLWSDALCRHFSTRASTHSTSNPLSSIPVAVERIRM